MQTNQCNRKYWIPTLITSLLLSCFPAAIASTLLHVDAQKKPDAPLHDYLRLGTATAPNGDKISVNSRYITQNGAAWLPVMGEYHYSRDQQENWNAELQKMKAAGLDIVASYIIWNHHEESEGQFNWKASRDLKKFVQLAQKNGLKVVVRIGPWAHAEARYGGIPDWVVNAMPTRKNDTQYLHYVDRFYQQIGQQLKGLLWKDGGPVIAVQIENEYNLNGKDEGAAHISQLKKMALKAGLDVPLYTVTGWDGAVYPGGEVTPVFGGYPDEPWGTSTTELAPKETYAFRFDSRVSGDLGAQTAATAPGTAETDMDKVPFLGAEYGAGLPAMYRRRTLVSADDIASMLPVQLGSGVNLLGYYMFHGGRNPIGKTTLEESTLSGGYNDTPLISYDFNAPLGPDGQQRKVLQYLRPYHYFLNEFGHRLAEMTVRKPAIIPTDVADLKTPRFSVRSSGDSAFVFFNNHVRQYAMQTQTDVQFSVSLNGKDWVFPQAPVTIPSGAYFIWPLRMALEESTLNYATAQPVTRLQEDAKRTTYLFSATTGIPSEFAIDASNIGDIHATGAKLRKEGNQWLVSDLQPSLTPAITYQTRSGKQISIVLLSTDQVRNLSLIDIRKKRYAVLSEHQISADQSHIHLRSEGQEKIRLATYPALTPDAAGVIKWTATQQDGLFTRYALDLPAFTAAVTTEMIHSPQTVPPVMTGGLAKAALQPVPETFRHAAGWRLTLPKSDAKYLEDVLLQIDFVGDIARLFEGTRMIDDWYYNGQKWQIGLRQFDKVARQSELNLSVLPLRADAPVYIPKEHRPDFAGEKQMATLKDVRLIPVYHLKIVP